MNYVWMVFETWEYTFGDEWFNTHYAYVTRFSREIDQIHLKKSLRDVFLVESPYPDHKEDDT